MSAAMRGLRTSAASVVVLRSLRTKRCRRQLAGDRERCNARAFEPRVVVVRDLDEVELAEALEDDDGTCRDPLVDHDRRVVEVTAEGRQPCADRAELFGELVVRY